MIFRPTQKLSTKIGAGTIKSLPLAENPYADWSARLFTVDRTQYLLLSNTSSLYSTVMYGKGITDSSRFIERGLSCIREFMQDDGQQFIYARFIAPASVSVRFATALDRSVTGSMNDLIHHATWWLSSGEMSPHAVGFKLNESLLTALGNGKSEPYGKPRDAFKALLSQGSFQQ
ncbi:MAG: hypothetical protein WD894_11905 [Pirellulales bacterium]